MQNSNVPRNKFLTSLKLESKVFNFAFVLFGFFLVNQLVGWPLLKFWNISGIDSGFNRFNDLSIVLESARCYPEYGDLVYKNNVECGNYLYGSFLLKLLGVLNFYSFNIYLAGFLVALMFIVSTAYISAKYLTGGNLLLCLALFSSPPFHLMVQRGHIDIFMFSIIVLAIHLMKTKSNYLATIFIFITVLIKFYTLPLLIYFVITRRGLALRIFSALLAVVSVVLIYDDLSLTPVKLNQDYPGRIWGLFGWEALIRRINETSIADFGLTATRILSATLFFMAYGLVLIVVRYLREKKEIQLTTMDSNHSLNEFLVLSIVFVSCFFAGLNYDFRLIFGVAAGIALICILKMSSRVRNSFLTILFCIAWLSYQSGGLEIFGDALVTLLVAIYLEFWRIIILERFVSN